MKKNISEQLTYMRRCLELAGEAGLRGKTPVGSVIVKGDKIIAEGIEGADDVPEIFAHAEAIAIFHACSQTGTKNLGDCVLYTTVEPCFMCSYLIRQTGLKAVYFGVTTSRAGGVSSAYPFLLTKSIPRWPAPPVVIGGVLEKECSDLLKNKR